jgi:hypothetical protein
MSGHSNGPMDQSKRPGDVGILAEHKEDVLMNEILTRTDHWNSGPSKSIRKVRKSPSRLPKLMPISHV